MGLCGRSGDGDLTFDARYVLTADSRFAITGTPDLVQLDIAADNLRFNR